MYLHLGQSTVIPEDGIIGVFDLDNTTESKITRDFLTKAESAGEVITVGENLPKSFVLYEKSKKSTVYLSQMNTATLKLRSGSVKNISELFEEGNQ